MSSLTGEITLQHCPRPGVPSRGLLVARDPRAPTRRSPPLHGAPPRDGFTIRGFSYSRRVHVFSLHPDAPCPTGSLGHGAPPIWRTGGRSDRPGYRPRDWTRSAAGAAVWWNAAGVPPRSTARSPTHPPAPTFARRSDRAMLVWQQDGSRWRVRRTTVPSVLCVTRSSPRVTATG